MFGRGKNNRDNGDRNGGNGRHSPPSNSGSKFGSNNKANRSQENFGVQGNANQRGQHDTRSVGGQGISHKGSRPDMNSRESEAGSAVSSIFSHGTHNRAPSTLGGATSVTGGMDMPGKGGGKNNISNNNSGFGMETLGNDSSNTLGNIANEMLDSKNGVGQRRDTLYEDARESVTPLPGARPSTNSANSSHTSQKTMQHVSNDRGRTSPARQHQHASGGGGLQRNNSSATQVKRTNSRQGNNNNAPPKNGASSLDEWGSRGGAGFANASQFEHTDAASFIGQDPIAQAGDFMDDDADVIFLSAEMGTGPNRQPMTRFRIDSVNLNVHSPVLSEMADERANDNEEIRLEEDAATLKLLFGLMYNRSAPALGMNEWQVVLRLARCAQKYDIARAKEVAAAYFTEQEQLGALSPFMTYAFAVQYKLPALEEAAAERSTRYDLQRLPELVFNMMGFGAFQSLATFHTRRQTHYQDVLNNITIDPKELADQCYQTGGVCVVSPLSRLKNKLAWPRQTGRDGSKRPPEPADVIRKLVTEIGQIDCGTCAKALVESALQVQLALESMPSYNDTEDAF